ncbi:hypothetical protein E4U41_007062 [Claviceps citrina]|nr:hypothetical protein E4U41_007062 [Claviceps citrina]
MQLTTDIPVPPDCSENPVEKLAYKLLCQEYRSRYTSLSQTDKDDFWWVLQKLVVKPSMTSVSRHTLAGRDTRPRRIPTLAEFELLAILYGVHGCSNCRWFNDYAANHPEVMEPRFIGIIVQIKNGDFSRIIQGRLKMPWISMRKVAFRNRPASPRGDGPPIFRRTETERSSSGSLLSQSSAPSSHSSAFAASGSASPVPGASLEGSDVTRYGSRKYVEEILVPLDAVDDRSTGEQRLNLEHVVAELQSRVAQNTAGAEDVHNEIGELRKSLVFLGQSLRYVRAKNHQLSEEVNRLGISHYTLRQEQSELQRRHAQLCEAMKLSASETV